MCKSCRYGCVLLLFFVTSNTRASLVLENFEDGDSSGWTSTGAWTVGGTTTSSPAINPPPGSSFFARSGEPNESESATGIFTSPEYTVSFSMLEWLSVGWSGDPSSPGSPTGESYFQILDANFDVKWQIDAAQSDEWKPESVDLLGIGLLPGSKFHFQAVDGRSQSNYAWIGFDELTLTGTPVAAVPEASAVFIWGLLGVITLIQTWRRREIE
jgi:hypothetical protein